MSDFKKIILPILGVIVFIVVIGLYNRKISNQPLWPTKSAAPAVSMKQGIVKIGDLTIAVDQAISKSEREKGLSVKTGLEEGKGMLFVMDKTNSIPTFWMKEMSFAIDIIWIKDGKIIQIDKNVPPPEENTPDNKLKLYSPPTPVDYVLEVSAGYSDQKGLKAGDSVEILPAP